MVLSWTLHCVLRLPAPLSSSIMPMEMNALEKRSNFQCFAYLCCDVVWSSSSVILREALSFSFRLLGWFIFLLALFEFPVISMIC